MKKTSEWGGRRPGGGRPQKEEKAEIRVIRVTDHLWEAAKIAAEREGKTRSRWIIDLMQRELDKTSEPQV